MAEIPSHEDMKEVLEKSLDDMANRQGGQPLLGPNQLAHMAEERQVKLRAEASMKEQIETRDINPFLLRKVPLMISLINRYSEMGWMLFHTDYPERYPDVDIIAFSPDDLGLIAPQAVKLTDEMLKDDSLPLNCSWVASSKHVDKARHELTTFGFRVFTNSFRNAPCHLIAYDGSDERTSLDLKLYRVYAVNSLEQMFDYNPDIVAYARGKRSMKCCFCPWSSRSLEAMTTLEDRGAKIWTGYTMGDHDITAPWRVDPKAKREPRRPKNEHLGGDE